MGYTTEFEGAMKLTPALTMEQTLEIDAFCEARHGGNVDVHPGMPGFWCDWMVDVRGGAADRLTRNGTEKSYEMDAWLDLLIQQFFKPWGVKVTGKMFAQGENPTDRWTMQVGDDQQVMVERLPSFEALGVTY